MGRYLNASGGDLTIKNCANNVCDFDIKSFNGAHMCNVSGKMKISGNQAQYRKKSVYKFDNNENYIIIDFDFDKKNKIIEIKANNTAYRLYCGLQGILDGKYENESNPLRYETSFDCWADSLNDTQKTICATKHLAKADVEIGKKYENVMTDEWRSRREKCGTNIECLWNFYLTSIKKAYEKGLQKEFNLFEYFGNLKEDSLYYPTDFTLLADYLLKYMEKEDYKELEATFSQILLEDNHCKGCLFHEYGVAGLYTIMESAFYANKNEIWIAFLHIDINDDENNCIIVYAKKGKTLRDIPIQLSKWLERLKPYFKNRINLKYFSRKNLEKEV